MSASFSLCLLIAGRALAGPIVFPRQDAASSSVAADPVITPAPVVAAADTTVAAAEGAGVLEASDCSLTTFPPATLVYTVTDSVVTDVIPEGPGCQCAGGVIAGLYSSINSQGAMITFCATATTTGVAIFNGVNTAVATSQPTGAHRVKLTIVSQWGQTYCNDNSLTNVANNPLDQWNDAGASAAWTSVMEAAKGQNLEDLALSNFIFDFFHMRPFPNCERMDNSNCDVTDDCGNGPPRTAALSTSAAQNNLTAFLADPTKSWSESTAKIADNWYKDPDTLYKIIKDGQVFNLDLTNTPNTDQIAVVLEKSLFAGSLPLVWYYNTKGTNPWIAKSDGVTGGCADASPVDKIIDDGFEYGISIDKDELISEVFEKSKVCDGDTAYWKYLISAVSRKWGSRDMFADTTEGLLGGKQFLAVQASIVDGEVTLPEQRKDGIELGTLRGYDTIDGSKWGGLTREDILMNVLNTYRSNGDANKPASLDLSTEEAIGGLYNADIKTAKGLISIPICSFDEASRNAKDGIDENNVNWPCNA